MLLIIKKLKAMGVSPDDAELRRKYGAMSGMTGIMLNLLLFSGKLAVALASGSVAVIADAFNNLSDAGSSIVTLVGFKLSGKKPDPQHPFGHGRLEYITGFVVSIAIIVMGVELGLKSIRSLGSGETLAFGVSTVAVLTASVAVKLYMALYNFKLAKFFGSAALMAIFTDSLSDSIATTAVLISIIVSHYTSVQLDSYMGILVSVFILYSGISAAKDTLRPLLGTPPEAEFVDKIEKIVLANPAIVGMHDLVVHDYGPGRCMISLHAEVPSDIDVFKAHCIIDDLENEIFQALGCEAVIHFDPIDVNDEKLKQLNAEVYEIVREIDSDISIHDFRYVPGETHTNLLFDIIVPFGMKKCDEELKRKISETVAEKLPNHICIIKCDRPRV